jgi:16S rRNA (cytidine1402-2'-O)-methyltransferase
VGNPAFYFKQLFNVLFLVFNSVQLVVFFPVTHTLTPSTFKLNYFFWGWQVLIFRDMLASMATLYVVATPIGNLEDITLRALSVLKQADCIACEDTRHTLKLLTHYNIKKRLLSYHSHNEERAGTAIISLLKEGKSVALVTDSGTPCVSDPGAAIVDRARRQGIPVVPVPGASALTALLSVAGVPLKGVCFEGFLSPKAGRRRSRLRELMSGESGAIVFESPFRVEKLARDIAEIDKDRLLVVGRELTKVYEEIFSDSAQNILNYLRGMTTIKGEFVILISGDKKTQV